MEASVTPKISRKSAAPPVARRGTTVALYARVSGEKQERQATIETQINSMERYCEVHGFPIAPGAIYRDQDVQNETPLLERREASRMLREAKTLGVQAIVVYETGRLCRAQAPFFQMLTQLEESGLRLISTQHQIDRETPSGQMYLRMQMMFTEFDYTNTLRKFNDGREKWSRATYVDPEDGQEYHYWMGGIIPYGYRPIGVNRRCGIAVDRTPLPGLAYSTAAVIERIFNWTVQNRYSGPQIERLLNAEGVPTHHQLAVIGAGCPGRAAKSSARRLWSTEMISRILRNPVYKGIHIYGRNSMYERDLIHRRVPAIVSEAIWEAAQEVVTQNRMCASCNPKDGRYLLAGKIRCAICGAAFQGMQQHGSRPKQPGVWFYRCAAKNLQLYKFRLADRGLERCPNQVVREGIEDAVWAQICWLAAHPDETMEEVRATLTEKTHVSAQVLQETDALKCQLDAIQRGMKSARRMLQMAEPHDPNAYTQSQFDEHMLQYREDERKLSRQIADLEASLVQYQQIEREVRQAGELLPHIVADLTHYTWDQKRTVIQHLVREVLVHPIAPGDPPGERHIEVTFHFHEPRRVIEGGTLGPSSLTPAPRS
jgi:site-specific DNA recombinase